MKELVQKSVAASLMISLGVAVLLSVGAPLGAFLFALGLLGVCVLKCSLFTGQCGFLFRDKIPFVNLMIVLATNLISGWIFGRLLAIGNPNLQPVALEKITTWNISIPYFIQSIFCGIIMYLAVRIYRNGNIFGIFFGVPLFILCGFQHCIANVIVLGVAFTFHPALIICILGNFAGSLLIDFLIPETK